MKINIKRIARRTHYTIGHLYIDVQYFVTRCSLLIAD